MGYAIIALDNPKNKNNVGAAMRAVGVFNAAMLVISGRRIGWTLTDAMKHYQRIPFLRVDDLHSVLPYDCVPVAIELIDRGIPLPEYEHPKRAFYIFGAEDATLGNRILSWCRDIVYIPTNGCTNLAATVNVVLYDRMVKEKFRNIEKKESYHKQQIEELIKTQEEESK